MSDLAARFKTVYDSKLDQLKQDVRQERDAKEAEDIEARYSEMQPNSINENNDGCIDGVEVESGGGSKGGLASVFG